MSYHVGRFWVSPRGKINRTSQESTAWRKSSCDRFRWKIDRTLRVILEQYFRRCLSYIQTNAGHDPLMEDNRHCRAGFSVDAIRNDRVDLVRCPGHNIMSFDSSDNYETESVCAASDRRATKRIAPVGNIPNIAGW